jgi:Methyltransferase domain
LREAVRGRLAGVRNRLRARAAAAEQSPDGSNDSARVVRDERLWELADRYRESFPVPPLSYGTARDLADSSENIEGLVEVSFDMKNLQRCWMLKAILGNVEPSGRLLEIGAGEPLVAGVLSRLGYEVTVVDPYDGSGNGPREYEQFRRGYRDLNFIRDQFSTRTPTDGSFAAVYSISVLEHIPHDQVGDVMLAAEQLLEPTNGCSIHTIDHVVAGWGAEEHLQGLEQIVETSKLSVSNLHETIADLKEDPDTYFVSAEAHDRWRGSLPYDGYPMRRIASIQLFKRC